MDKRKKEKLSSRIKPLAARTRTELKQYARFLRRTWGDQKADDITRKMVEDALNGLHAKNRNTHRKYLRYIRMFFIWAKDNQHSGRNPTDGIKIKSEDYEAKFYPVEKVRNLLRYVFQNGKELIGYYALLAFAVATSGDRFSINVAISSHRSHCFLAAQTPNSASRTGRRIRLAGGIH